MASSLPRRRTHAPKSSSTLIDDVFCQECGSGHSPAKLLLCDKCDRGYHLFCLRPILTSVPKGSWFCGSCSNHKPKCKHHLHFSLSFQIQHRLILPMSSETSFRVELGHMQSGVFIFCYPISNSVFVIFSSAAFPLVQTKIIDFFRIQRSPETRLNQGEAKWSFISIVNLRHY